MGGNFTLMARHYESTSSYSDDTESGEYGLNGLILNEIQLGPDIISTILSHVPDKNLIIDCRLVCKIWKQLIDDQTVWRLKCERKKILIPHFLLANGTPLHFYRNLCFKNPYGRNFIRNPNGAEGLRYWHFKNGGDGWAIEKPPVGADACAEVEELGRAGVDSCFSTSYQSCEKYQLIDLIYEGCHDSVLDEVQPEIFIQDWHAARFDCACRYALVVTLLDGKKTPMQEYITGSIDETQWTGRKWSKVEHVFKNYGVGLRYIRFHQVGHDLQFWAGNYGSKMTGSTVKIVLPN